MSNYLSPSGNNDNGFVNGLLFPPRDEDQSPPPPPSGYHRGTPTTVVDSVRPQSRCINENNQKSLTWNISLTDDQDVVSERFLRMHIIEPTTEVEKFGPAILTVPENIRKQADELLKPSEIHPNEIYDLVNIKVSWILPTSYQQYLKSIPPNVLEKGERHVLYPWTQWNAPTGTWHRPSPNSIVPSPVGSDRSSLSSPSVCAHVANGMSFHNNNSNSDNNNSNSSNDTSFSYGQVAESNPCCRKPSSVSSARQRFAAANNSRDQQQTARAVRSPSVRGRSASSSLSSPSPFARFGGPTAGRTPSRLYYCVRADTNTVNKVVEHYCTFCYKNHEPPEVYGSHLVRDATRTTCPKLRALRCKHCNGTGDNAHTIKYCPFLYANYG